MRLPLAKFGTNGESKWKTRMDYNLPYIKNIYKCQHWDNLKKKGKEEK